MPNHPYDSELTGRYNPWRQARAMDLQVEFQPLEPPLLGYWVNTTRVIVVHDNLSQAVRRCVLAHELRHAERGDDGMCATAWHESKLERQVHADASRRLILLEDLAKALLTYEHEADRIEALWVDARTYRSRLDTLTRIERAALDARTSTAWRRVA